MSSSDQLEELRRLNKSLLERLMIKQNEINKQLSYSSKPFITRDEDIKKGWQEETALNGCGEFHMKKSLFGDEEPDLLTIRGSSSVARRAFSTPRKTSLIENPLSSTQSHPKDLSVQRLDHMASEHARDTIRIRSPVKRVTVLNSTVSNHQPSVDENFRELNSQYMDRLIDEGNIRSRDHRNPKSILLTPNRSSKRDTGRVTFLSDEPAPHTDQRSARALLGYDWIAGLLEVNSPIANKSDQFFSEIGEFRRVNKEECVHECFTESGAQDSFEEDLDPSLDTHQCVYCYRVNHRLFTSPVGAESACPICKKRRFRRHAVPDEQAYIRVSIPRSTLLPPYKYRAHRRKSFDPTDSFALPSHCLAGWENAKPSCDLRVTSLDLKNSVDPNVVSPETTSNLSMDSASYYASRARSENLLNMSRSIIFHHNKAK